MINAIENIIQNEFSLHDISCIDIQHEHSVSKGRLTMLNAKIKDQNYFLINFYGPNKSAEAVCFYQDLSITSQGFDLDSDSNAILGGDFNCPLDLTFD